MSFRETLDRWFHEPTVPLLDVFILDPARPDKLQAGRHYVRVRVVRMHLKYESTWLQEWMPAVQSHVRFDAGNLNVEIPNLADAKRANLQADKKAGLLVIKNVPLTPTVPFHGGVLELSASLLAIKGANRLNDFVGVLGGFAEVLQVPQFTAALAVAQPLIKGMDVLLDVANDHIHLGYFNSYRAGELSDGHILVVRSPAADTDPDQFVVVQDTLHVRDPGAPGGTRAYVECDHMLLRVEVFEERDDWEMLTLISEPWAEVQQVMSEQAADWEKTAAMKFRLVLLRVAQAKELTKNDRIRIGNELTTQYKLMKQQDGAYLVEDVPPTFRQLASRASSRSIAATAREPTIEEWFANLDD